MTDTTGAAQAAASTTDTGQQAAGDDGATRTPSPADLAGRPAPTVAPTSTSSGDGDGERRGPAVDMTGWPQAAIEAYRARDEQASTWQREAVKSRVNAKASAAEEATAATLQKVAQALGLAPAESEAPTVEKVTAELQQTRDAATEARKEAAFLKAAIAARIDPSKLDYVQYLATRDDAYRSATPDADGFADTLATTVRGILATDPTLTAAAPPRKSGADTYGGASGSEISPDAFAQMNAAERSKLYQQDPDTYQRLNDAAWQASRGR